MIAYRMIEFGGVWRVHIPQGLTRGESWRGRRIIVILGRRRLANVLTGRAYADWTGRCILHANGWLIKVVETGAPSGEHVVLAVLAIRYL